MLNQDQISEINELVRLSKKYRWSDIEIRKYIESHDVSLTLSGFYSPLPSISEIENAYEYNNGKGFWFREDLFSDNTLLDTLNELSEFSHEFDPPFDGDKENPQSFFLNNGLFSWSDAMSYYCFIRSRKPAQIIEIGSGFSTLVAIEAINKNSFGKICCIEPYPRKFLKENRDVELVVDKVQNIDLEFFNKRLSDNDILFVDSSHAVKVGSDVQYIHLHIIPRLLSNILIHVHDVFLPAPMPKHWELIHHIHWAEQYLVLAYLLDNPKCTVLFASDYNARNFVEEMDSFMHKRAKSGGGSFWYFRKS